MNARMTLAAAAALCLTASTALFAQTAPAAPQPSAQSTLTTATAPRAWSETTPQPPTAATAPPRATRPALAAVAPDEGERQAPPQTTSSGQAGTPVPTVSGRFGTPQKGQLLNVKVEFTITDQIGTKPPVKKTMTMVVADRESSRIRTSVNYRIKRLEGGTQWGRAPLSVDVNPWIEGNKIRVDFSIEYSAVDEAVTAGEVGEATVSERLAAVLDSGVPVVVAQSSDAISDRKVTIEIKATIMK